MVFKNKDHIVVATTGTHPGFFFPGVTPVILDLFICRGCFIEKVLLFPGKSLSPCRITLYVGKEWIASI